MHNATVKHTITLKPVATDIFFKPENYYLTTL